jgi:hypothetical protein
MRSRIRTFSLILLGVVAISALFTWLVMHSGSVTTGEESVYVTRSSIEQLTQDSKVVVIGTFKRELGASKVPIDSGRSSIRKDFEVDVERYLKGNGGDSVVFTLVVGMEDSIRGETYDADRQGLPLERGTRYVLFLRDGISGLTPTAEPWWFRLSSGRSEVQSPVRFTQGEFPSVSEGEFTTATQ